MSLPISRRAYADMYGPTTGDRVRLGDTLRFEPGERKRVTLVALAGERIVYGGNGLIAGQLDDAGKRQQALEKLGSF